MIVLWIVDPGQAEHESDAQQEESTRIHLATSIEEVEQLVLHERCEAVFIVSSQSQAPQQERIAPLNDLAPVYLFLNADKHTLFIVKLFLYYLASVDGADLAHLSPEHAALHNDDVDWQKSLQYIRDNLDNNELSLEDVARQNYVSKWHFSKVFKKKFGITFRDYLIEERIALAKKLLLTNESVTSVCYEVGYGDLTHFGRIFQKRVGMPPSRYKKKYWNPQALERRRG
ncbi:helix-turn-helix domain-containing protein [Xylanibacillus composti]|uniref:Helix-turn-helix transcriptional regulator n=1 Tax=Xylanibacillus composti TaxID=1572762 RepID=A0A8J4H7Z0_9BACL|nr:AraC family transcriptional regulator [Xylanibacillus composti]GIQ71461.1 helix-turn-helix transcriptional regulator [Xylanibacillus composti]